MQVQRLGLQLDFEKKKENINDGLVCIQQVNIDVKIKYDKLR